MMPRVSAAATAAIVAMLVGWWAVSLATAERKLSALAPIAETRGSYQITLEFPPERFHQQRLQEAGRLVEVRGSTVYMMDVAPDALRGIAGEYWVDRIARWEGR